MRCICCFRCSPKTSGHTWLSLRKPQRCSTLFGLSKTNSLLLFSSYRSGHMTLNNLPNLEGLMKRCTQHPEPLKSSQGHCWDVENRKMYLSSGIAEGIRISLELITRQNLPENKANRDKSEGKRCDKPDWHMISDEPFGPAMPECGIYCGFLNRWVNVFSVLFMLDFLSFATMSFDWYIYFHQ